MTTQIGLYDIYPLYHVPFWQQEWIIQLLAFSLCGIIFLFCLIIAYIFYKKTQKIVYTDPWLLYMQNLESLYPKPGMTAAEIRYFYDNLTCLLKKYIYVQYSIAHYKASDQEMYSKIQESSHRTIHSLLPLLERSIIIKFAGMQTNTIQVQEDYNMVKHFMLSTKPTDKHQGV